MTEFVKKPLAFIAGAVSGSGAGFGLNLSGFIRVTDAKEWLTAIAIAFSLTISCIISAYYKSSPKIKRKRKFAKYLKISALVFIVTIVCFFVAYNILEKKTTVNVIVGKDTKQVSDSIFFAGLYYRSEVKNEISRIHKINPSEEIDFENLFRDNGRRIENMWSDVSRVLAKLVILLSYIFFIAGFVASITITTEIMSDGTGKKKEALKETPEIAATE